MEKILKLVDYIAKTLVENPDQVSVALKHGENADIVELRVAQTDMGKVIGKQGRIAKAIRSVVRAASYGYEKPVFVEIV